MSEKKNNQNQETVEKKDLIERGFEKYETWKAARAEKKANKQPKSKAQKAMIGAAIGAGIGGLLYGGFKVASDHALRNSDYELDDDEVEEEEDDENEEET